MRGISPKRMAGRFRSFAAMTDESAIEVNGARLWVREVGTGDPIVFVHGSASDWRTWQEVQDLLGEDYRTVAYSRRYHPPNPAIPPEADYSMDEHVSDLAGLVDRVRGPVSVVGHSYGALVALHLVMRQQVPIDRLVLIEPPAVALFVSDPPRPAQLGRLLLSHPRIAVEILKFGARGLAPARAAIKKGDLDKALDVFGTATLGASTYQALSQARRTQARNNLIPAELLGSGFPHLDPAEVAAVDLPVLLVGGSDSTRLLRLLLDRLEELIPNNVRVEIPRASHIVHEDNPEVFLHELRAFLQTRSVGRNRR